MRRTLTICLLVAILLIAVAPSLAQGIVWSGNALTITQSTELSGVTTRINAKRNGQPLGGYTSKSGICAEIVAHQSMTYPCSLETAGIQNIQGAVITPDHGVTVWPATLIPSKGYTLNLPIGMINVTLTRKVPVEATVHTWGFFHKKGTVMVDEEYQATVPGLSIGEMAGLEWRVLSKDQHNNLRLVAIPINWNSNRSNSINFSVLVQQAPVGFESMTDLMVFAHLRGFEPAWASPDPAVFVRQKMVNDLMATPVDQVPDRQPIDTNTVISTLPKGVKVAGQVSVDQPKKVVQPRFVSTSIYIYKGTQKRVVQNQTMNIAPLIVPVNMEFRRNGSTVAKGEAIYRPETNIVEIYLTEGDFPAAQDRMWMED